MSEFENQFLYILNELVPHDYEQVISGCHTFNLSFSLNNAAINPLLVELNQFSPDSSAAGQQKCRFNVTPAASHIFTKRVHKTRFYVSSLVAGGTGLYLLDFHTWDPVPVLYRVILCQFAGETDSLTLIPEDNLQPISDNIFKCGPYFLSIFSERPTSITAGKLIVKPPKSGNEAAIVVMAFGRKREELTALNISAVFKNYHNAVAISRMHHIDQIIRTQDKIVMEKIDSLWSRIQFLTPDRKYDKSVQVLSKVDVTSKIVLEEMCALFGWGRPDGSANDGRYHSELQQSDSVLLETILDIYSQPEPDFISLSGALQKWWNIYSLPLYQLKFASLLRDYPGKIYIVYRLAMWLRLPWSKLLLQKYQYFRDFPDLQFLAFIMQLIQIRIAVNDDIILKSGPLKAGNFIELKRNDLIIRFTRYGKKTYSVMTVNKNQVLKIDKEVSLRVREKSHQYNILPDVMTGRKEPDPINNLEIRYGSYCITLPLLWKETELQCQDFRLKTLLKKDRFQISCRARKPQAPLNINGELLDFSKSSAIKLYKDVKMAKPVSDMQLLDVNGRSFFLENKAKLACIIAGWIQNHKGILINQYNLKSDSKKQYLLSGSESGCIENAVILAGGIKPYEINIKYFQEPLNLNYIEHAAVRKVLLYSPEMSKGHLLVVVHDNLPYDQDHLGSLFLQQVAFLPVIIPEENIRSFQHGLPTVAIVRSESGPAAEAGQKGLICDVQSLRNLEKFLAETHF